MIFYTTLVSSLILDILSKYLLNNILTEKISIFWDFVYLQLIKNDWIAFWIDINTYLLKVLTIVLIIWIFYYHKIEKKKYKDDEKLINLSFWLILGWAIWNAIHRIFYSEVIDFIWIKYFSVFNLADSFITIWAWIYIYIIYKNNKK